jgi:hypothetical protein
LLAQFFMTEPAMTAGSGIAGGGTPSSGGIIVGEYMGVIPFGSPGGGSPQKIVQLVR